MDGGMLAFHAAEAPNCATFTPAGTGNGYSGGTYIPTQCSPIQEPNPEEDRVLCALPESCHSWVST